MSVGLPFPDEPLLTINEVAAALRVSKMTIYRLVQAGELPAIRIGRSIRVPASALRAYLDNAA
jgi:excisionase family DNA binding protein